MKTLKYIILLNFILILLTLNNASADSKAQLLEMGRSQDNWKSTFLNVEGFEVSEGTFAALVTPENSFRLQTLPRKFVGTGKLSGGLLRKIKPDRFLRYCQEMNYSFATSNKANPDYKMVLDIFPFAKQSKLYANDKKSMQVQLENPFKDVGAFSVAFTAAPNSYIYSIQRSSESVLSYISSKLTEQKANINEVGSIEINLTGMEDVVCDLLAQSAKLSISTPIYFEMAKLKRVPKYEVKKIKNLQEEVGGHFVNQQNSLKNYLSSAVALSSAVQKIYDINPADWGFDNLWNIWNIFFDLKSGEPRNLSIQELDSELKVFDDFVKKDDWGWVNVDIKVTTDN